MALTFASKLIAPLAVAVAALGGGAVGWVAHGGAAQAGGEAAARAYIADHPDAVPGMLDQIRQNAAAAALSPVRVQVETAFPGAVLGNPRGRVTLVEFLDYACGYCRKSVPDVEQLIAANPDLRVVVREWPILTPESADAARMALAAAAQGKFAAFHVAMFGAGRPSAETIAQAAQAAGLDMARAGRDVNAAAVKREIAETGALARRIGAEGTPTWEIDGQIMVGAVGSDTLAGAIADARAKVGPAGQIAAK